MSMRDPNGSVSDTRMAGQTKKPQEMKSPQPPVCIIENIDGQLRPCESGLKILESIELPLVVVAVFGMYRTGKSYLMNRLCNKKQGFSLGFTIRPHTKGIWMWGLPHPRNPEYCLLLLDTEGMGDTEKGDETSDKWLFALSLLMSSLFIYNSMKKIDRHALFDLHIVTKLKNFIKIKTQTNDSKEEDELWKTCLPFVWVIRDFCLEMEIDGKEVTADEYLETCLLPNQEKNKEYNECRKCITELFPDRKCFIFPQPTTKVKHLRNLENIADSELDEDFVVEITKLRDYVYSRAEPRIVQGVPLNGRMLSTLLQTFTECISRGDAPSLQTVVQSMADRENSKIVAAAETCYRESMDKLVLPVKDAFKLQQHHIESERKAFNVFKQLYFPDKDYKFQNELKVKLQTLLQQYCKRNKKESKNKCQTILTQAFEKVEEKYKKGEYAKPGGYRKYIADWNLAEEEYLSAKGKGPKLKNKRLLSLKWRKSCHMRKWHPFRNRRKWKKLMKCK
ncbi:guanylate-binding protein 1-like isoform X2 [Protopterus annectens]|uniref:guanylate-binding protein 1-like isoform X2 n=1 Tax=Protopterus annectens TaxID=7888 RepID=UPI001CF96594|nr:guanylate-binding protein 1-like isoform X2 [Protopterus annectens]